MKMIIEMPNVRECEVGECAYNQAGNCHARAITVGDGVHPACDTFFVSSEHAHDTTRIAGVGACKVAECAHNRDFECQAEAIRIGHHERHADCITFSRK